MPQSEARVSPSEAAPVWQHVTLSPEIGLIGKDGWVFLGNQHSYEHDQALGRYQADAAHIERLANWVRGMAEQAERHGIPFLFAIAPAKWAIYPDKVPGGGSTAPSLQDRLLEALGPREDVLDLRPALRAARAVGAPYSPLNSHWTDFGAAHAWRAIATRLSALFAQQSFDPFEGPLAFDTVDAMNECAGLMGLEGENPWTRPVYTRPLPNYDFVTSGFDRSPQPGIRQIDLLELPMYSLCHDALSNKRALIFRDSTGSQLSPFLTSAFSQTHQVFHGVGTLPDLPSLPGNPYMRSNFSGRIEQFNPDVILFVMTERYLASPIDGDGSRTALRDFEATPAGRDHCWPLRAGTRFLRFDNDITLAKPALIDFTTLPDLAGERVIRLRLNARGPGALCLGYTGENQPVSEWFWLENGLNVVYFRVPAQIALGHFWIARHENSADVMLSEITIRPL